MEKITHTPFNEYREEQSGIKLIDYFVQPAFFDELGDNRPKMIYGSRGTGKTTLLKALTLEQADDKAAFLQQNDYIGIYCRTDLNISSAFYCDELSEEFWHRLYSYYFACYVSRGLFESIDSVKEVIGADEKKICQDVSVFYGFSDINDFSELIREIMSVESSIEIYLNNLPYMNPPKIGAFARMLREIPRIVIENSTAEIIKQKHFIYLIDEFESLKTYQQKAIFSMVKYADQRHTYIIGLRPLGLKALTTIGDEYIRETDDFVSYVLDSNDLTYKSFAKKVCNKRLELFYKKYFPEIKTVPTIESFFEMKPKDDELKILFSDSTIQEKHSDRVRTFLKAFDCMDESFFDYFVNNQEQFYLVVLKLIKDRSKNRAITHEMILQEMKAFKKPDRTHSEFIHNYQTALVYYIYHLFSNKHINYSSFSTLVSLSGNTLRYLLEMCNEIFLHISRVDNTIYEKPHLISGGIQSNEVVNVSKRRFDQIRAVPELGPKMRQFMNCLGSLASIMHEDSRLAKWEPNHFSIHAESQPYDQITDFLVECVSRGILIQYEDNKIKVKNSISFDQDSYQIHPIYTPKFQISYRKKQKFELSVEEIATMIGNDILEINKLIKSYKKANLSNDINSIIEYLKNGKKETFVERHTLFDYYQGE